MFTNHREKNKLKRLFKINILTDVFEINEDLYPSEIFSLCFSLSRICSSSKEDTLFVKFCEM